MDPSSAQTPIVLQEGPLSELGTPKPSPAQLRKIASRIFRHYQEVSARPGSRLLPPNARKGSAIVQSFLEAVELLGDAETACCGIDRADELLRIEGHGLHRAKRATLWRLFEPATAAARRKKCVLWVDAIGAGLYDTWGLENGGSQSQEPTQEPEPQTEQVREFVPLPSVRPYDREYQRSEAYLAVCDELRSTLQAFTVDQLFLKLEVLEASAERLILVAPTEHYISWLEQKYVRVLVEACTAVFSRTPEVYMAHREQGTNELYRVNVEAMRAVS